MRLKKFAIITATILLLSACADQSSDHPNIETIPVVVMGPHEQTLRGSANIVPLGGLIRYFSVTDGALICASKGNSGASSTSIPIACNDGRSGLAVFSRSGDEGHIDFDNGTSVGFISGSAATSY